MFASAYSASDIRTYLVAQGFVGADGQILNETGIYNAAYSHGVSGAELDVALSLPAGQADRWADAHNVPRLTGANTATITPAPVPVDYIPPPYFPPFVAPAPTPAPAPAPTVNPAHVTTVTPPANPVVYATTPYVAPTGSPAIDTSYLFDPSTPAVVSAGSGGASVNSKALLYGAVGFAALLLLKKRV